MKKKKAVKTALIILWILLSPLIFIGFLVIFVELTAPIVRVTDLDYVDRYNDYKCYDHQLLSINTQDEPVGYYALYYDNGRDDGDDNTYYICYPIVGESKDEFMKIGYSYGTWITDFSNFQVYQNPDRPINVRKDWTIKEIQIYNGSDLLYTITDKEVLQEFYTLYNNSDAPNRNAQYNDRDKAYSLRVRVIFHESESIVWQSGIRAVVYHDGNMAFCIDIATNLDDDHSVLLYKRGELYQALASMMEKYGKNLYYSQHG